MLASSAFRLLAHPGTMNEMADVLANVHRFQIVDVRPVSIDFEVSLLLQPGLRCHS